MKVPDIARQYQFSEKWVRVIIHNFNKDSFESLPAKYGGGGPPRITSEQKERIVEVALSRPVDLGMPFTQWSLTKLQEYVILNGIVESISHEKIRQILKEAGISNQRTKTWKESNDPDFEVKKTILELYRTQQDNGIRICVDGFGPLQVKPEHGANWRPVKKPDRIPATYNKTQGVQHFISAYDLEEDSLFGKFYDRKRWLEFLDFLKHVREKYPENLILYVVLDNFSPHKKEEVKKICR